MFHRIPIDIESPCGHRPGGSGAACTGAGSTYMLLRENSSYDCDSDPTEPPLAVEVEEGDATTPTVADDVAPAFEVALLELEDVEVEVEGAGDGVDGGVQVGQLVPPFLQVAKAPALASASAATRAKRMVLMGVGPRRWWWKEMAPGGA